MLNYSYKTHPKLHVKLARRNTPLLMVGHF